jgi:hypothetical protein
MTEDTGLTAQTAKRKRARVLVPAAAIGLAGIAAVWYFTAERGPSLQESWALLDSYCVDCHNDGEFAGGLSLESRRPESLAEDPELWEHVVQRLRGSVMPPPGSPRPDEEAVGQLVASLETNLDRIAAQNPNPGYVTVHRLNRREYAAAVEELLGLEIDPSRYLPNDLTSDGFDNIADVLRITPAFFDQYIAAARDVSIQAIGNADATPNRTMLLAERDNQNMHIHGLPLGTRGGVLGTQYFPADGEYEFSIDVGSVQGDELRAYPDGWIEFRHRLILTIDGERVFEDELGGEDDSRAVDQRQIAAYYDIKSRFLGIRVPVTAGSHEIGATFVVRSHAESDKLLQPIVPGTGERTVPRIRSVEIVGPYEPTGVSNTASRERIFICEPAAESERLPCAERILGNLARQAYRRSVSEEDLSTLLNFYRDGAAAGGFEEGIRRGLMAILASPKFLFRLPEPPPTGLAENDVYQIGDLELASRLSFFLWSRGPDARLLELAERGELAEPGVLVAEVDRMLADPRSKSLVTDFAFQWLALDMVDAVDPDPRLYPNFTEDLRASFLTEMELYLDSILRADQSVLDLLDAEHTFVNETLARHYRIPDVRGDRFQRVELQDDYRHGLFGKGAILMLTSYPNRTSPVLRGTWIMEHILATPPSPPPPGVETDLDAVEVPDGVKLSIRGRLELHREDPSCNHCHGVIDPMGLALENFNAIGEWRDIERAEGVAIDATGQLATGRPVTGPKDLRDALLSRPEHFLHAMTEKLMTYALGRRVEYYDMPTVRAVVDEVVHDGDYRFSAMVKSIVASDAFQRRKIPGGSLTQEESPEDTSVAAR